MHSGSAAAAQVYLMREAERMIEEDGCERLKLPMKIK
jgi:hypothetical protein